MKRLIAFFAVVLLVSPAGCSNGTTPAPDPFFGWVTVSPPSTQMNAAGSAYVPSATSSNTPRAVVAAPVNTNRSGSSLDDPWPRPPSANFQPGSTATASPNSMPSRPIYVSNSAIEDSVRTPSYDIAPSNPRYGSSPSYGSSASVAAAGAGRALSASPSSLRQLYPAPNLQNMQAVNGRPVREQSDISYHSADGSIPQYTDPRSSFGQSPRARFRRANSGSEAPRWTSDQASAVSGNPGPPDASGFGAAQANTAPSNLAHPCVTPGTLASGSDLEKLLPPIRGYADSRPTARAQSTARRSYAGLSYDPAQTSPPPGFPAPSKVVNIADLSSSASRIATRPSGSGSSSGTRRLSYEVPVSDHEVHTQGDSSSVGRGTPVQPISFTSPVLYRYEEDYSRLRGELEHSGIDQRWKLRYISVGEEKSDHYGGSVILNDPAKLSGFERGDFVEVYGRILSGPQSDSGYAPCYEITDIQRVH